MRYRPRQVCLCDPNRLLSSLPRFSAHCHARSLLPTVVNHSTIYDENPDLHHGLLGPAARRSLFPACSSSFHVFRLRLRLPEAANVPELPRLSTTARTRYTTRNTLPCHRARQSTRASIPPASTVSNA